VTRVLFKILNHLTIEEKIMITIKGSIPAKTLKTYQAKSPFGNPGQGTTNIPIDTPNFNGNRTPNGKILAKYLEGNDGFHWGLFGSPLVARLPDDTLEIYDGGHRVSMLQQLYPHMKTFPGTIVDVDSKEEISRLFYRVNGGAASFVNPETRFINQVLGQEKNIGEYVDVLRKTEVTVYDSDTNYVPKEVTNPRWKTNVKPLEDMVKENKELAIWAYNLYTKAWDQHHRSSETGIPITGQIVKALHTIASIYANYFDNPRDALRFEDWFISMVSLSPAKSDWLFANDYKHERMELRHLGTALGIWKKYCNYARGKFGGSAPALAPIEDAYNAHDKKRAAKKDTQII